METIKQNYLSNLNKNQKEAIINPDGPCLVVAGAGSGKTKVLTSRVVHILLKKKKLGQIKSFASHLQIKLLKKCKIEYQFFK